MGLPTRRSTSPGSAQHSVMELQLSGVVYTLFPVCGTPGDMVTMRPRFGRGARPKTMDVLEAAWLHGMAARQGQHADRSATQAERACKGVRVCVMVRIVRTYDYTGRVRCPEEPPSSPSMGPVCPHRTGNRCGSITYLGNPRVKYLPISNRPRQQPVPSRMQDARSQARQEPGVSLS